ncbi:CBS domain-containing protein [Aliikangiella coralliicola]|uniref:CBS domain-containing protein n=1 Tax=Aliikangiella coralliicola TaxID=2592383 RepID=A0A545TSU0_9GAMM|nr:CBS domain-containing protein [Aliikangiella coralliicola]TQV80289.1 CBS domain-containing protein [Aliikangiella coralliicola]
MASIESIMTPNPVFVSQHSNINKARMLMAEKKVRHLPVKDASSGKLIGMVSQKAVLAHAIKVINQRGFEQLEHTEKSMDVASIMDDSPAVFDISTELLPVAKSLLEQRSGCIAIESEGKLAGVVTSSDFVKLAVQELDN